MSFSNEQVIGLIKKNPISVGCGVLMGILLITSYFRSGLKAQAETDFAQKSSEADRLALNLRNASQLQEQVNAILLAQKDIEERMIRAGQLTTNRQYFYKLESETGVKLLDLRQSTSAATKKAAQGAYIPTTFTLNVQGDYVQLLNFVRRLESGMHYCRILSASSNRPAERGAVLVLSLNLELLGLP